MKTCHPIVVSCSCYATARQFTISYCSMAFIRRGAVDFECLLPHLQLWIFERRAAQCHSGRQGRLFWSRNSGPDKGDPAHLHPVPSGHGQSSWKGANTGGLPRWPLYLVLRVVLSKSQSVLNRTQDCMQELHWSVALLQD